MKRIIKNNRQPDFFKEWKRSYRNRTQKNATYKALQQEHDEYLAVKRFLINEQYHLCCYCCNRVEERDSHIEHFIPQSVDDSKQLEYQNMFISCKGYIEGISTLGEESCGHRRKNWYERCFIVSPLEEECDKIFEFLADGSIQPSNNDERAEKMIENFGLNSYALKKAREAAINAAYENVGFYETIDDTMLREEIQFNNNPNAKGELPPFCDAVSYVLNQL
jgi:uncharacterized protein (TIGR02646 family)